MSPQQKMASSADWRKPLSAVANVHFLSQRAEDMVTWEDGICQIAKTICRSQTPTCGSLEPYISKKCL